MIAGVVERVSPFYTRSYDRIQDLISQTSQSARGIFGTLSCRLAEAHFSLRERVLSLLPTETALWLDPKRAWVHIFLAVRRRNRALFLGDTLSLLDPSLRADQHPSLVSILKNRRLSKSVLAGKIYVCIPQEMCSKNALPLLRELEKIPADQRADIAGVAAKAFRHSKRKYWAIGLIRDAAQIEKNKRPLAREIAFFVGCHSGCLSQVVASISEPGLKAIIRHANPLLCTHDGERLSWGCAAIFEYIATLPPDDQQSVIQTAADLIAPWMDFADRIAILETLRKIPPGHQEYIASHAETFMEKLWVPRKLTLGDEQALVPKMSVPERTRLIKELAAVPPEELQHIVEQIDALILPTGSDLIPRARRLLLRRLIYIPRKQRELLVHLVQQVSGVMRSWTCLHSFYTVTKIREEQRAKVINKALLFMTLDMPFVERNWILQEIEEHPDCGADNPVLRSISAMTAEQKAWLTAEIGNELDNEEISPALKRILIDPEGFAHFLFALLKTRVPPTQRQKLIPAVARLITPTMTRAEKQRLIVCIAAIPEFRDYDAIIAFAQQLLAPSETAAIEDLEALIETLRHIEECDLKGVVQTASPLLLAHFDARLKCGILFQVHAFSKGEREEIVQSMRQLVTPGTDEKSMSDLLSFVAELNEYGNALEGLSRAADQIKSGMKMDELLLDQIKGDLDGFWDQ